MTGYKHLSYDNRLEIDAMRRVGASTAAIAAKLKKDYSTIWRELRRGKCQQLNGDTYEFYTAYSPEIAQNDYEEKASHKGPSLKIGHDHALVAFIEHMMLTERYSPAAVLGKIKNEGLQFKTSICVSTLYTYIDNDLFLNISNKNLPQGKQKKKKQKKVRRVCFRHPLAKNITERPAEANERKVPGHWEMDTVVGKRNGKSSCILVLTERKTRKEFKLKLKTRTTREVVRALDKLQRRYKARARAPAFTFLV